MSEKRGGSVELGQSQLKNQLEIATWNDCLWPGSWGASDPKQSFSYFFRVVISSMANGHVNMAVRPVRGSTVRFD